MAEELLEDRIKIRSTYNSMTSVSPINEGRVPWSLLRDKFIHSIKRAFDISCGIVPESSFCERSLHQH